MATIGLIVPIAPFYVDRPIEHTTMKYAFDSKTQLVLFIFSIPI